MGEVFRLHITRHHSDSASWDTEYFDGREAFEERAIMALSYADSNKPTSHMKDGVWSWLLGKRHRRTDDGDSYDRDHLIHKVTAEQFVDGEWTGLDIALVPPRISYGGAP